MAGVKRHIKKIWSHGLFSDQNQYLSGCLSNVNCPPLTVQLAASASVCTGPDVKLVLLLQKACVGLNTKA